MKTLDIQYRQAQSVNIDLGMLDIANIKYGIVKIIFLRIINGNLVFRYRFSP